MSENQPVKTDTGSNPVSLTLPVLYDDGFDVISEQKRTYITMILKYIKVSQK